jgi:uncharacterized protein YceK
MRPPLSLSLIALVLGLAGCATPDVGRSGRPLAFHDTRLQYAVLTNDGEILRTEFNMNPDRTFTERAVAGLVLPWSAALETVFYPVSYGYAWVLDE